MRASEINALASSPYTAAPLMAANASMWRASSAGSVMSTPVETSSYDARLSSYMLKPGMGTTPVSAGAGRMPSFSEGNSISSSSR
ncbi:hypothetical protein [Streptomyces sp. 4F14]|uniref:hypothetical protein n=1 Tax=Streptomyces sp. 4F14 TaxID=3394380 RepID=UPI003A884599